MSVNVQFICDECGAIRKPSNHWFLGRISDNSTLSIMLFDEKKASLSGNSCLCGASCIIKYTSEHLSELKEKQDEIVKKYTLSSKDRAEKEDEEIGG